MNNEEKRALEELLHDLKEHNLHYALSYEDKCYEAIINLQQEPDKYKNIVDELEKWLEKQANDTYYGTNETLPWCIRYREVLDKLKELKGSDE